MASSIQAPILHQGHKHMNKACQHPVAYPGILFRGGRGEGQQIQVRTEDRENGDLGAVAP